MSDYNGYTNRSTWLAALWLDNDESVQRTLSEVASTALRAELADVYDDCRPPADPDDIETTCGSETATAVEEVLKGVLDDLCYPEGIDAPAPPISGLAADLLGQSYREIDTRQLAWTYATNAIEEFCS